MTYREDKTTYRRELENASPDKPVVIRTANCGIEVLGEDVTIPFVDFEYSPREEGGEEILRIEEGERLSIEVMRERERDIDSHIRFHFPKEGHWNISVKSDNGRIAIAGLGGTVEAGANNGKIRLTEVKGSTTVTCANGSVECRNLEGTVDVSTSNGRINIRDAVLEGGSLKSGNGRIVVQFRPAGSGDLSIFSGNGRVKLALPDDADFQVRTQTRGRLYNHLENYSVQNFEDATVIQKGAGEFSVHVQNVNGGVSLVDYDEVDTSFKERHGRFEFDADFDPGDFLRGFMGDFDPSEFGRRWSRDISEEIPRVMSKMAKFGRRFGRMGEDVSRQFHERRPRSGSDEEIRMILDMLREGKITAEEAEKLISAVKARRGEG